MADEERKDDAPQDDAPQEDAPKDDDPQEDAPQAPDAGSDVAESGSETPEEDAAAAEQDAPPAEPAPEEAAPEGGETPAEEAAETGDALKEAAETARRPRGKASERGERDVKKDAPAEVIPGEHLEPDLVLEEQRAAARAAEAAPAYAPDADADADADAAAPAADAEPAAAEQPAEAEAEAEPRPLSPLDLAADARYQATGKRKTSVARVMLKPGSGTYTVNGRPLDEYFPRARLQRAAREPLETARYDSNMDVSARIHGGGVSAQAGALRHGVARALIEVDPTLRVELKRRGFLTRDARAKERKKAGLKKARKRPQFSKR